MSDTDHERDLNQRLEALTANLDALRGKASKEQEGLEANETHAQSTGRAMSLGFRVLAEFVSGILVGGVIGWQIDVWFNSTPIALVVFLTLGTAAGMWNVYRLAAGPTSRSSSS